MTLQFIDDLSFLFTTLNDNDKYNLVKRVIFVITQITDKVNMIEK